MIEFKNVYLKYIKDFFTLYDISFKINDHTLFLGECSDGTNSVFRLIAKIDKKYSGEIYVQGKNLKEVKDRDLDIAYITEQPYLFRHKTVFENLYYPLKIRKFNKFDAKNLINHYSKQFKLDNLEKKSKDLSKSEQIIITLLRALVRKPKYVLVEHLFSNLDKPFYATAIEIIEEMKKYSTIIACEINDKNFDVYRNFKRVKIENGSLKL